MTGYIFQLCGVNGDEIALYYSTSKEALFIENRVNELAQKAIEEGEEDLLTYIDEHLYEDDDIIRVFVEKINTNYL